MSEKFDKRLDDFFKNYQDRGMKKWQGFFLSDHTAAIRKDDIARATIYQKKETMSQEEASELLMRAYANHRFVSIQLKERDTDGKLKPDVTGFVQGYEKESIMISGTIVDLDNINHVEFSDY